MNAKEMFEELGFEQTRNDGCFIKYKKADNGIDKIITFSIMLRYFDSKYGDYPFTAPYEFDIDTLKAINKQCEELGWIEKEERPETNYEHYKDIILEDSGLTLALVGGKPCKCISVHCSDCEFSTGHGCSEKMKEWLNSTHEKTKYKLNKFEYDLIQTYSDCSDECKFCDFMQLNKFQNMGYFSCIDSSIKISDILENCEISDDKSN